jgi:hypothetical protein
MLIIPVNRHPEERGNIYLREGADFESQDLTVRHYNRHIAYTVVLYRPVIHTCSSKILLIAATRNLSQQKTLPHLDTGSFL